MTEQFVQSWRDHTSDIPVLGSNIHYTQSADRLRKLIREGPYNLTDLRDAPERFFLAHQMLSEFATRVGPGFGIRFTVQVNLFAGTIIGLGNTEQVNFLSEVQKKGLLGCFCLTERLAGVNSGLVVNTTAEWDEGRQMFLLDCPDEGSKKNWISQGLTADLAVVVATLLVKGKSYGPHAFVMEMRRNGELVPGVTVEDMGNKTIGNDLDNARVSFSKVWVPRSALLDRYAGIEKGEYVQYKPGTSNMDMIGQRLYTGRAVIASSTLVFARTLFKTAREYTDSKRCWHPKGAIMLSEIPQLDFLYKEADQALGKVEALRDAVEARLCECLKSDKIPTNELVEMVAALKVKAIETTISLCFRLKQELGSYALMGGTGFEKMDYLQCCKFAEGDSRILMQKIARDRLQAFSKKQEGTARESEICFKLGKAVMTGGKNAWTENWKEVYGLADAVIDRVVDTASTQPQARL
mmetsp:Transcript_125727/g.367381  ORF Transcript_125727/g.367381 Transcript_125727/m.367381 type:complete len:466 (+) Transcript_125727:92-1489(+)